MKRLSPTLLAALAALPLLSLSTGCLSVKTEHEVKPIHITMDVNLKVDKEIDQAFGENTRPKPPQRFLDICALLDRHAVGIDNRGYIAPRADLTEDEKLLVDEENAVRRRRFREVAEKSGVSVDSAEKRGAARMRERAPSGKGILYQDENGAWKSLD